MTIEHHHPLILMQRPSRNFVYRNKTAKSNLSGDASAFRLNVKIITMKVANKDHSLNNCPIVAFGGAKEAYLRGAKGDINFTSSPKFLQEPK